jgi:hypothetical protein
MTIERNCKGQWEVKDGTGNVLATFSSHEEAWRWFDRHAGEPISISERNYDWSFWKRVNGE